MSARTSTTIATRGALAFAAVLAVSGCPRGATSTMLQRPAPPTEGSADARVLHVDGSVDVTPASGAAFVAEVGHDLVATDRIAPRAGGRVVVVLANGHAVRVDDAVGSGSGLAVNEILLFGAAPTERAVDEQLRDLLDPGERVPLDAVRERAAAWRQMQRAAESAGAERSSERLQGGGSRRDEAPATEAADAAPKIAPASPLVEAVPADAPPPVASSAVAPDAPAAPPPPPAPERDVLDVLDEENKRDDGTRDEGKRDAAASFKEQRILEETARKSAASARVSAKKDAARGKAKESDAKESDAKESDAKASAADDDGGDKAALQKALAEAVGNDPLQGVLDGVSGSSVAGAGDLKLGGGAGGGGGGGGARGGSHGGSLGALLGAQPLGAPLTVRFGAAPASAALVDGTPFVAVAESLRACVASAVPRSPPSGGIAPDALGLLVEVRSGRVARVRLSGALPVPSCLRAPALAAPVEAAALTVAGGRDGWVIVAVPLSP